MPTGILDTPDQPASGTRQRRAERAVNVGLVSNALLAVTKLVAGIFGHSQALLADGVNSTSDVAYYVLVRIFVRLSGKPADVEHPYGHHQLETIAAVIVGAFVVTTGIAIFWDSLNAAYDLLTGTAQPTAIRHFALLVALATTVAKLALVYYTTAVGRKTKNAAVAALARDHRNDVIASTGAALGILLGLWGMLWVDPIAGALVALVVMKTGIDILRESSEDLMDAVPSELLARQIHGLLSDIESIEAIEDIHAHRFGPYLVVNITIGIDGNLSVATGDQIASQVENRLINETEMVRKVYVHYHPTRWSRPGSHGGATQDGRQSV